MPRYFTTSIPNDLIPVWNKMVRRHMSLESAIAKGEFEGEALRSLYWELRDIEKNFTEKFTYNVSVCKPIELSVTEINKVLGADKSDVKAIKVIIECIVQEPTEDFVNRVYKRCIDRLSDKEKTIYLLMNHAHGETYDRLLFETVNHLKDEVRHRESNFTVKELRKKYNTTDNRVRQLYYNAVNNIVLNIKPVIADMQCIEYKDRTLDQCVNMPQRVYSVLSKAFRYTVPYVEPSEKTLSWIIKQDYSNDDLRGLGELTFNEMDTYLTEQLGLEWKRSRLFINLYNHYNKKNMSGSVIGITKDRMREIIIKAKDEICNGEKQCKGLGCKKCMMTKLGLSLEEYTILFK